MRYVVSMNQGLVGLPASPGTSAPLLFHLAPTGLICSLLSAVVHVVWDEFVGRIYEVPTENMLVSLTPLSSKL